MSLGSLLDLLRSSPSFSFDELLSMTIEACTGMSYLAQSMVIHRDVACRNLLVTFKNPFTLEGDREQRQIHREGL